MNREESICPDCFQHFSGIVCSCVSQQRKEMNQELNESEKPFQKRKNNLRTLGGHLEEARRMEDKLKRVDKKVNDSNR